MAEPAAPRLRLDVEKRIGEIHLDVRLDAGTEALVLFGPSGAGKTTILNTIAGLVRPDAGVIEFDGAAFFRRNRPGPRVDLPARRRGVGYVMQDYALFPHMTVLENVMFPLRGAPDREARALALLERVSVAHLAHERPGSLSGGQQQRVVIARALAANGGLLLLDEPFAALDGPIRERLQADLRTLQRELRLVMILVTHRLEDAFALGDRIAVLRAGRLEQVGPIEDVVRRPATRGVAEIMGIRNLLRARVVQDGDGLALDWAGTRLEAPIPDTVRPGSEVTAYIQPENVKIVYPDRPLGPAVAHNVLDGAIVAARHGAGTRILTVRLENGYEIEVRFPVLSYSALRLEPGAAVRLALRRDGLVVLDL
ncbi:MAG TPA: ABC transporter ATP-binding protein [Longimicrobiales bacterium]|nr:ABC transporter ATP-binding protein [Longimicrobiales bacterium]